MDDLERRAREVFAKELERVGGEVLARHIRDRSDNSQAGEAAIRAMLRFRKEPVGVDYTTMANGEMLTALGDNADKWATAFMQVIEKNNVTIDQDLMRAWFANAIEQSSAVRQPINLSDIRPKGPALSHDTRPVPVWLNRDGSANNV